MTFVGVFGLPPTPEGLLTPRLRTISGRLLEGTVSNLRLNGGGEWQKDRRPSNNELHETTQVRLAQYDIVAISLW